MKSDKPVVLFTSPILRYPPIGGPALRIVSSIKALSQVSELYLYSPVTLEALGGASSLSYLRHFCKEFYFAPSTNSVSRFAKRLINSVGRRAFGHAPFLLQSKLLPGDHPHLLRIARQVHADVVWLGYGNISYPTLDYLKNSSNYKVVVDTDSVWSRFILRRLAHLENRTEYEKIERLGKQKEDEEARGARLADVTTAVSEVDAAYYRKFVGLPEQVQVFSNAIDLKDYARLPEPPPTFKKPSIYLAGTFFAKDSPMEDAARWVIRDIFPLLRQQIPDLHLYIIGKASEIFLADIQDAQITITGEVESVLNYLGYVDVALVPLRFESGTRFKILEAGACGIPVVSTTLGAEGLPVTHRKNILLADSAEDFAASIVELLKNQSLASDLAQNLKRLVFEQFSISALAAEGQKILDYLLPPPDLVS